MNRALLVVRHVVAGAAVIAGAAGLGIALTPAPAVASTETTGWTCYQWDVCHSGSSPCCFEMADIRPGQGRGSTMCEVKVQ